MAHRAYPLPAALMSAQSMCSGETCQQPEVDSLAVKRAWAKPAAGGYWKTLWSVGSVRIRNCRFTEANLPTHSVGPTLKTEDDSMRLEMVLFLFVYLLLLLGVLLRWEYARFRNLYFTVRNIQRGLE